MVPGYGARWKSRLMISPALPSSHLLCVCTCVSLRNKSTRVGRYQGVSLVVMDKIPDHNKGGDQQRGPPFPLLFTVSQVQTEMDTPWYK